VAGVVVIHDAMGMSHDLRRQTDWLAGMGYLAAAPDLYRGGRKLACIHKIMREARQRSGPTFDDIEAVRSWADRRRRLHWPRGRDRLLHGAALR
jgi:carboxymethylenebutenolidase